MFLVLSFSLSLFVSPLFFDIFAGYICFSNCLSLPFSRSLFDDTQPRYFFYSQSDFYTRPLSALMRQRRRMVLSRRALSLFPGFRRSRIYSVAIGVVPINTLEEARSRAPPPRIFIPLKQTILLPPSKPDRSRALAFFTRSLSGYAAQP